MKSMAIMCILFMYMSVACLNSFGSEKISEFGIPEDNLPAGFKLLAIKTNSTPGVNITEDINEFFGAENIGPSEAVIGVYIWGPLGQAYDAKITLINLTDEKHAQAAITNYRSQSKYQKPLYNRVDRGKEDRFAKAIVNGHEVLEIRDVVDTVGLGDVRYLFLWNNNATVVLVEGNNDRSKSLELASATKL
ncbi:MAG: hypothetical protein LUQ38_05650 [Methanotrichaceae archaeon]|nr:hypothetical protein [Methanotrichaceae archaeon]MDD1758176.1 hypothetical protein [Methanotrichaceae archaeon]